MHKELIWFSWQPTPYNDVLFRALAADDNLDLLVVYRSPVVTSHPWKTALAQGYKKRYYHRVASIDWISIWDGIRKSKATFIVAGWDHPTSWLLLSLLRLLGRKYVIWTDTPNNENRNGKNIRSFLRKKWLDWILSGARRLMSTGQVGVKNMIAMGGNPAMTLSFPFFLDLDAYGTWSSLSIKYNHPDIIRFVSSGRLINSMKGHDIAIKALAAAFNDIDREWEYCIAGTGPDKQQLEQLVEQLNLKERVTFLGWFEPSQLIDLLKESHVLIHPSKSFDPFPNAVLEGMAAGCIVFASDYSGSALDRIESGRNGFIHKAGDINQLALQIRQLVTTDSNLMTGLAVKSRKTSEEWPVSRGVDIINDVILSK